MIRMGKIGKSCKSAKMAKSENDKTGRDAKLVKISTKTAPKFDTIGKMAKPASTIK